MTAEFKDHVSYIADEIIALSLQLGNEMETWRDVVARDPDSMNKGVNAGFISKPDSTIGIEMVVDIQAPPDEQAARLRIWAIESTEDASGNERFNNIQLTYRLDYDKAHKLVEQTEALTHDELAKLAHDPANQLESVTISDLTGRDTASNQLLGKRYDVESDALGAMTEDLSKELVTAMDAVLERLKKSDQQY